MGEEGKKKRRKKNKSKKKIKRGRERERRERRKQENIHNACKVIIEAGAYSISIAKVYLIFIIC